MLKQKGRIQQIPVQQPQDNIRLGLFFCEIQPSIPAKEEMYSAARSFAVSRLFSTQRQQAESHDVKHTLSTGTQQWKGVVVKACHFENKSITNF